jgi:hypothetical protein
METTAGRDGWFRSRCFRAILYSLLGLAVVDGAVASFQDTWRRYDPNEYRERLEHCRRQAWDLVLIGGSPVVEGLDPAQLAGLSWDGKVLDRAFNLGLNGATTSTIWHAVEHGLPTPPRLVVYGITASDLNDSRDEPNGVWTLMNTADVTDWLHCRPDAGEWCVRHFLCERLARLWNLYYYRNSIRLWAADLAEARWPASCPETAAAAQYGLRLSAALQRQDGFAPREEYRYGCLAVLKARNEVEPRFRFLENYRLGGHLRYLHRILDWGASHGTDVVLLDMPVAADLEALHAPAFTAYRAALAKVERERRVRVLRATRTAVGLDDTHFGDRIHLNGPGHDRLGTWVRAQLTQLGAGGPEGNHEHP